MTKPKRNLAAERVTNMKNLVTVLMTREMSAGDVTRFLGMARSGARGYTNELVALHVASVRIGGAMGRTPYFRIPDRERAIAYLARLDNPDARKSVAGAPTNYARAILDPSRHIHVTQDDEPTAPRVARLKIAAPDPHALPSDFFKPSTEFCERRSEPRPEPVRVTGFAALDVRFERRAG